MTPYYEVSVDGTNINNRIGKRIVSVSMTDKRGFESDSCEIVVDDTKSDERVKFPRTKAKISITLGYRETVAVITGEYVVDGYSFDGPSYKLTIRGKSANQSKASNLKLRKTRSWHDTTLGEVIRQIATETGLQATVSPALANRTQASLQQSNESSQHFLTRLAQKNSAFFKVSHDRLIFMEQGKAETVSGKNMPAITIKAADGDVIEFDHPEAPQYDGVQAEWRDHASGTTQSVQTGAGNRKTLRKLHKSKEEATAAANSEQAAMDQQAETLTMHLALARAGIQAESRLNPNGYHPEIDGDKWVCTGVTTSYNEGGLIQTVEAERPIK